MRVHAKSPEGFVEFEVVKKHERFNDFRDRIGRTKNPNNRSMFDTGSACDDFTVTHRKFLFNAHNGWSKINRKVESILLIRTDRFNINFNPNVRAGRFRPTLFQVIPCHIKVIPPARGRQRVESNPFRLPRLNGRGTFEFESQGNRFGHVPYSERSVDYPIIPRPADTFSVINNYWVFFRVKKGGTL